MGKIYNSIDKLVGKTPLLRAENTEKNSGLSAKLLVKLECFNPTGSAKDRAALYMIEEAEKEGKLKLLIVFLAVKSSCLSVTIPTTFRARYSSRCSITKSISLIVAV